MLSLILYWDVQSMNKLVWIGVAAVAAVLLFTWWFYSTPIVDYAAPPDRFKQIDNTTTSQTQTPPTSSYCSCCKTSL
jgi:hypothetical protein